MGSLQTAAGDGNESKSSRNVVISSLCTSGQVRNGYDTIVGMSSGEIRLISVRSQMNAPAMVTRPARPPLIYNREGSVSASRCVAVAFLPKNDYASFISIHANGDVLLHLLPSDACVNQDGDNIQRSPRPMKLLECNMRVTNGAVSPDGSFVAITTKDGILAVYNLEHGEKVCTFRSYYGGLLCLDWSSDNRYLAAGGEDDLIMCIDFVSQTVIAHCQGHTSFVSGVAFNPKPWNNGNACRSLEICSVGLDGKICFWDIETLLVEDGCASMDIDREEKNIAASVNGFSPYLSRNSSVSKSYGSVPKAEMNIIPPLETMRTHSEPLCGVRIVKHSMFVVSSDGSMKRYYRANTSKHAD